MGVNQSNGSSRTRGEHTVRSPLVRPELPSSPSDSGFQLTVGATLYRLSDKPLTADRVLALFLQVVMVFIPVGPNPGFEAKMWRRASIVMGLSIEHPLEICSAANMRPLSPGTLPIPGGAATA